eukprot:5969992-Pleurochrysis_carterae.AAC.3
MELFAPLSFFTSTRSSADSGRSCQEATKQNVQAPASKRQKLFRRDFVKIKKSRSGEAMAKPHLG